MTYVKSFLVGLAASLLSAILYFLVFSIYAIFYTALHSEGDGEIGWDIVSIFRGSLIPRIVVLAAFVLGFIWQFRRASH